MTGRLAGTQNFSLCQRTPSFAHGSNWPLLARAKLTATQGGRERRNGRKSKREQVEGGMWREEACCLKPSLVSSRFHPALVSADLADCVLSGSAADSGNETLCFKGERQTYQAFFFFLIFLWAFCL